LTPRLGLKNFLKRSYPLHSAYKLFRDFRQIPKERLTEIESLRAITRVLPNTMLTMPRLFDLYDLVRQINLQGLRGDLVECGVWNGGAVGLMALANFRYPGPVRKLHLFDSFEGLPQPTKADADIYSNYLLQVKADSAKADDRAQLTAIGACVGASQPAVEEFLIKRLGIKKDDLEFHVGWFQDTVPAARETLGEIALLRLDGDWYESTKICISNLYDNVVMGGFVVIDDYGTFEGCRKAIDEFFDTRQIRPDYVHTDSDCVYFRKLQ